MIPNRLPSVFQTAAQGLALQRQRINVASRNIANINTSSPKGSANIYRPETVKSLAPRPSSFEDVLSESMLKMKQTMPGHMSGLETGGENPQGIQGLGPRFKIVEANKFRYEYDPNNPDANKEGMVRYPDIDMVHEMTTLVSANRLYEANLSSIEAEKEIMRQAFSI
ncbi:MAG TPA: flagellar basal body rod C-terminal domain-containing protein [Bacteroidales bacterium]|nr:flagellar basal body rod C-terminal domain-containing protein [Bacteroidales bacterium]